MAEPRLIDLAHLRPRLQRVFDCAAQKVGTTIDRHPDYFPMYTEAGRWALQGERWTDWCSGFHTGMMWLCEARIGHPWWREKAEHYCRLLEHRKLDQDVHDLGFVFLNSYLPWYERTGDPAKQDVVVTAGRTLSGRYDPNGRYLRSFLGPGSLFIDIMMNVPIIFYAAKQTGDQSLHELAVNHCRTTAERLVRDDGGTAHEGLFDPKSGKFLRESTQQGKSAASTWSRGLAWSLYGFGTVYTYTGAPDDLSVAERNADYLLAHSPEGLVPPWDFDAETEPDRPDDSSAAAIAASGLWNLADLTRDPARAARYQDAALTILDTLCSEHFVAWNEPEWEGLLKHGVYHLHKGLGVDESVMWGDFFFLEAVSKVLNATGG